MCSSLISVCNGSASQNNWVQLGVLSLETDMGRINFIEVIVDFSQNCTNSTCFGEFGLYRFDDDGTGNGANVLNYKFVTMSLETGTVIHLNATNTTLYLALRDTGTCVTVSRVRAYYSSCQNPDVMPFTEFPAEVPFGNDVSGSCNGGSLQTGNLSATCSADGVYSLPQTPCECNVGYNGSDNLTCTCMFDCHHYTMYLSDFKFTYFQLLYWIIRMSTEFTCEYSCVLFLVKLFKECGKYCFKIVLDK